jgi:hypothetical protein
MPSGTSMERNMHLDDYESQWYEILYDVEGNPRKVLKPRSQRNSKDGEFLTFDSSHGHCALCGSIEYRGSCFK